MIVSFAASPAMRPSPSRAAPHASGASALTLGLPRSRGVHGGRTDGPDSGDGASRGERAVFGRDHGLDDLALGDAEGGTRDEIEEEPRGELVEEEPEEDQHER